MKEKALKERLLKEKEIGYQDLLTTTKIASMIDHTLLKSNATKDQIISLCEEAKKHQFASVCVNPYWVTVATNELKNSQVGITTVIGFPLGANRTSVKIAETRDALDA